MNRRDIIKAGVALGLLPGVNALAQETMLTKPIPSTGESLPVIGLGTYSVFDVDSSSENIDARAAIVDALIAAGGSVIDTSPMYNRSEAVIGDVLARNGERRNCFLATKVWTDGEAAGESQMERSADLMNTDVIDLMQVHNRRDLDTHWPTIAELKEKRRVRYDGVTDYRASAHDALVTIIERYKPQFIQINYSLGEREAERRLLPAAADLGVAVLINRPFVAGRLFRLVGDRPLPDWAREFADSWGQFFLKYIVSHPAVTCVIPATSKLKHMVDNAGAGHGVIPDAATRARMVEYIESL
jgi:diketogulonate reductase-like aldo/keto reductase